MIGVQIFANTLSNWGKLSHFTFLFFTLYLCQAEYIALLTELFARSRFASYIFFRKYQVLYVFCLFQQVQKLQNIISSRASQYNHDMKRKEREFNKLKERLNQLLADKKERKQGKMEANLQ